MESNQPSFRKFRQQLRELAKEVMSNQTYAEYLNQESTWEHQMEDKILSIKNAIFTIQEVPLEEENLHKPETIQTDAKIIHVPKTDETDETDDISKPPITYRNDVSDSHSKESDHKLSTAPKENLGENTLSEPNDRIKPFHMNIQSKTKKRRRSIFRKKKKKTHKIEQVASHVPQEQTSISFSDGIRNIISQISTTDEESQPNIKIEPIRTIEHISTEIQNKQETQKEVIETVIEDKKEASVEDMLLSSSFDLFDINEEKQDILDTDLLDLNLHIDIFHELPPPIPEYLDTDLEIPNIPPDASQRIQKEEGTLDSLSDIISPEENRTDPPKQIEEDSPPIQKDIEYYTKKLLLENSIPQRIELFMQRLSIHLQEQHWLEGCSDAVLILQIDASQSTMIKELISTYQMPDLFQDIIYKDTSLSI